MKKNLVVAENSENYRSGVTEAAVHALELVCTSLGEDVAEQISRAFISRIAEARALREVIAWAHSREEAFIGRHQADLRTDRARVPASGWMGCWSQDSDWQSISFFPHALNRVLRDLGYQPETVLRGWRDRGWILAEQGRCTTNVNIDGEGEPDVSMVSVLRQSIREEA